MSAQHSDNTSALHCQSIAARTKSDPWQLEPQANADAHTFLWINRGSGRVHIDGTTRGFAPNSVFFLPSGAIFCFEFTPASSGWTITIPKGYPSADHFGDAAFHQMFLCDDINRELASDEAGREVALQAYVSLLAIWLMRRRPEEEQKSSPAQKLMARFTQLLEQNYASEDSASDYAQTLSVSPAHLTRICQKTNNKSATTLIQERKVLEAKKNLALTDAKIGQIALANGFGSAAYFTRVFSQKTGKSPRDFRFDARSRQGDGPRSE
jgi:AraC-like DNA-binding protein